jgi:hypothetical protein
MDKSEKPYSLKMLTLLASAMALSMNLLTNAVDSLAIKLVLPPARNVQKVNRAGRRSESERVVTVVFRIVQHGPPATSATSGTIE